MKADTMRHLSLAALLGWMAVIFLLSHQSGVESSELSDGVAEWISNGFFNMETLTYLVRKGAHFGAYGLLGMLACGWLAHYPRLRSPFWAVAGVLGVGFAATDEFHQYFIPGRSASIWDVLLDSAGVVAGILLFMLLRHLLRKRGKTYD